MPISSLKQPIRKILHWIQRYTKTDMVYVARGSFWMMVRQGVVSLLSVGMAIAFANLLPQEVYGAYKYVLSVAVLLAITTLSGINTSLTRSVAQGFDGTVARALSTRMRWGLIGTALAFVGVAYYGWQGNMTLATVFIVVALFVPLKSSFSVYRSYWQGKKRFDVFAKYAIIQELIATVPLLIALFLTDELLLIVGTYFCAQTVASAVLYAVTVRQIQSHRVDETSNTLGKHLSFSGVLHTVANNITDIILWHLLGPAAVAVFTFATRPPMELRRLFTQAFPIALPKFSQRSKEDIQRTLLPKIGMLYLVFIPVIILYILAAPFLFQWLFPQYINAVFYSQLYALTILFAPLSLFGIVFQALGKTREIYLLSIASSVLIITCLLIFVPWLGLLGAVIATLVELFLLSLASLYLFKRM